MQQQAQSGGGGSPPITVTGCQNQTVANIIKGTFSASGANHGKPVYKKDVAAGGVSVLIYFWDERDGPNYSGWWFGPQVGGDQVWAYNGNKASQNPPASGWKVPWDGEVDPTIVLQFGGGAQAAPMGKGMGKGGKMGGGMGGMSTFSQKQAEEMKKREAEQKKRQEELKVKRDAEETRRKEQAAALAVRKAIQKVRTATPETYDELRAAVEEAQANNLEAMGSQAEKVSGEATAALEQAQKRIDEINQKKVQDEIKKQEQEKLKKEMDEKVDGFVKATKEEANAMLEKVKTAEELAEKLKEGSADGSECDAAEKTIDETREEAKSTRQNILDKQKELAESEAFRKVKRDILELTSKLAAGVRSLEKLGSVIKASKEKAARKTAALEKIAEKKQEFSKYDKDKDGKLNRNEVKAYCKAVVEFDLAKEALDKIMKSLEPITVDKFRSLHQKASIEKSEVLAREKRAEDEAKQKVIEDMKSAVKAILDEAAKLQSTADATAGEAEVKARPLIRVSDKGAGEINAAADEAEALAQKAEGELSEAEAKFKEAKAECEGKEELAAFEKSETQKFESKEAKTRARLTKINAALKVAREKAMRKEFAEIDQKRSECATAIRSKMTEDGKTGEQYFESVNGGNALDKDKFAAFVKELAGVELVDGQSDKLFDNISGEAGEITKDRFLELVRVYYKCVKATVMSEDINIKSKTVRRLELGEVLEALEGPTMEEGANVKRVRCQAMQDDAAGWVTLAGNQGTAFLEPGGNFYTCVKETLLTDGLSIGDSKTIRRIAKGEVVEVLEFQKKDAEADLRRIKGKAKLDGAVGWITLSSNSGTAFMEPC